MSEKEPMLTLDPQLEGLRRSLSHRIVSDILTPQLIKNQLIDKEGEALSPMTKEGLNSLLRHIISGLTVALSQSQVDIPDTHMFDEVGLIDKIVYGLGETEVTIEGNTLNLKFRGENAVIQQIRSPLDLAHDKLTAEVDFRPIRIFGESLYGIVPRQSLH